MIISIMADKELYKIQHPLNDIKLCKLQSKVNFVNLMNSIDGKTYGSHNTLL